jgi:hypothetical protein
MQMEMPYANSRLLKVLLRGNAAGNWINHNRFSLNV